MMTMKTLMAILISGIALLGVQACDEGPLEEAGENIDEGFEDAGDAIDDAADEVDEEF